MITANTVKKVRDTALDVIELCDKVDAERTEHEARVRAEAKDSRFFWYSGTSVLKASLRRRSMDLTRALADLRRR